MKRFAIQMMLVLAATIFLNSCTSEGQFGDTGRSSSTQPVPGEKGSSGPDVLPAAGGGAAGARVGW